MKWQPFALQKAGCNCLYRYFSRLFLHSGIGIWRAILKRPCLDLLMFRFGQHEVVDASFDRRTHKRCLWLWATRSEQKPLWTALEVGYTGPVPIHPPIWHELEHRRKSESSPQNVSERLFLLPGYGQRWGVGGESSLRMSKSFVATNTTTLQKKKKTERKMNFD